MCIIFSSNKNLSENITLSYYDFKVTFFVVKFIFATSFQKNDLPISSIFIVIFQLILYFRDRQKLGKPLLKILRRFECSLLEVYSLIVEIRAFLLFDYFQPKIIKIT